MRKFSSYGPVDPTEHFCVERRELIERCVEQLIGNPDKGGHYFTIYAARQAGKTWLMRRAVDVIRERYADRFIVATLSMQGVQVREGEPREGFLERVPMMLELELDKQVSRPATYEEFRHIFSQRAGLFDRPVILLIDEFDKLRPDWIDALVGMFRDIYLSRKNYLLHSLALIGVRAVLGVDSDRGSPFNVQRSLRVPNFTPEEVRELFRQYQAESGQVVQPGVLEALYDTVRGQPGLTCWFGELLTEKYNPPPDASGARQAIGMEQWREVYARARQTEFNNNILNLLAKAKAPHAKEIHTLFIKTDVPFSIDMEWCRYLYMSGIIDQKRIVTESGETIFVCQFASPFVQLRLYNAFSSQLGEALMDVPALDGLDMLDDVFPATSESTPDSPARFNVAALLQRYKTYLVRLREKGRDPFHDQPLRADFQLPEAVGHFHLYAWLLQAVGREVSITPEFPTGNGKVDLWLRHRSGSALVEVKSLGAARELEASRRQAAKYGAQKQLPEATLAAFLPTSQQEMLSKMEGTTEIDGIQVHTVAIAWRP